MPKKLKNLKVSSVDLCPQGANPDAHIRLFKSEDADGDTPAITETFLQKAMDMLRGLVAKALASAKDEDVADGIAKDAETFGENIRREQVREVSNQIWSFSHALMDSLQSILWDEEVTEADKKTMMSTSLSEFAAAMGAAIPLWAAGKQAEIKEQVAKTAAQEAAFAEMVAKYAKTDDQSDTTTKPDAGQVDKAAEDTGEGSQNSQNEEETDTMKINKSKMTPEERATLEALEKKYGTAEPDNAAADDADGVAKSQEDTAAPASAVVQEPELHPDVKKALEASKQQAAEIETLKKSLEIKDLTVIAKKYEVIGKNADELAVKLYDLKKAGGTAYEDIIGLLDDQVTLVEKSGMFKEIGSGRAGTIGAGGAGSAFDAKVAEIQKADPKLTAPEAIAKAFETNPELAEEYEKSYSGRNN